MILSHCRLTSGRWGYFCNWKNSSSFLSIACIAENKWFSALNFKSCPVLYSAQRVKDIFLFMGVGNSRKAKATPCSAFIWFTSSPSPCRHLPCIFMRSGDYKKCRIKCKLLSCLIFPGCLSFSGLTKIRPALPQLFPFKRLVSTVTLRMVIKTQLFRISPQLQRKSELKESPW